MPICTYIHFHPEIVNHAHQVNGHDFQDEVMRPLATFKAIVSWPIKAGHWKRNRTKRDGLSANPKLAELAYGSDAVYAQWFKDVLKKLGHGESFAFWDEIDNPFERDCPRM